MKLIKCYNGKETEVEYQDAIALRLLQECPYDKKSKNAIFKQLEGDTKIVIGKKAEVKQIIPQTTFDPEEARKILEAKKFNELRPIYQLEIGKKVPVGMGKKDLINELVEKYNG